MIEDVENSFQLLLCAFHEFTLHSIMHEFKLFEAPNTAQVLPCAFESSNTIISFHYIQSHVRFRRAKSLNAAQILVRGCWSSMCLRIFKLHHELPLHSIMCKFRWAKSLNAAQIWCEPADHLCPSQSSNNIMSLSYIQPCMNLIMQIYKCCPNFDIHIDVNHILSVRPGPN